MSDGAKFRRRAIRVLESLGCKEEGVRRVRERSSMDVAMIPRRFLIVASHWDVLRAWGFQPTMSDAVREMYFHQHHYSDMDGAVLHSIYDLAADDYTTPIKPGPEARVVTIGGLTICPSSLHDPSGASAVAGDFNCLSRWTPTGMCTSECPHTRSHG